MVNEKVVVKNRAGLHARPASMIVQTASTFSSSIFFVKDNSRINAKSIMNLLTMGAAYNTEMVVEAQGDDEQDALQAIVSLFEKKFEE
ncbi:MAG: HPr family phosphocarrier protein [Spirochaetaceae bacterium]|jgi:phosphocarrier protein HPr|nr:HPr family phosphocarrier protein [Spirochaetaceae bacterium]